VTAIVGAFVLGVAVFLFGLGASQANAEKKRLEREAGTRPPSKTHPNAFRAVMKRVFKKNFVSQAGGRFARNVDTGSLKVIWVTFQIIMSCSWNLDIEYPPPFNNLLSALGFMSLDFLSIECLQDAKERYYTTVYLWSIAPIVATGAIFITALMRISYAYSKFSASLVSQSLKSRRFRMRSENPDIDSPIVKRQKYETEKQQIIAQGVYLALLLSYLVLPPVAMKHFQALDCIPFSHDGSSDLRADPSIDCASNKYLNFRIHVAFFVVLYQSIPIVWFILLYRKRKKLHQRDKTDILLALYVRDQDKSLDALRFLFNDYLPARWWFEVVEIYRRTLFVGILPLISPEASVRASVGIILGVMSVAFYREEQPFRVSFTNFIAFIAQYVILLVYYCGLSLSTGLVIDFGLSGIGMGIFLMLIVLFVFSLVIWLAIHRMKKENHAKQLIMNNATKRPEDASGFSDKKFGTTFRAIFNTAVPATHVLAFHYTDYDTARKCQMCGIRSHAKIKGVMFSLQGPHQITDADRDAFASADPEKNNFEAVLVVSLPARMLVTVPGFDDVHIRMIQSSTLLAMRPTAFTAVFDPGPWLRLSHAMPHTVAGPCLLPPTCIVRTYVLIADLIEYEETPTTAAATLKNALQRTSTGSNWKEAAGLELSPDSGKARLWDDMEPASNNEKNRDIGENIQNLVMEHPKTITEFCIAMARIRVACAASG
jgi:hypothetical protein